MNPDALLQVMVVMAAISTLSMLACAAMVFGMFRTLKSVREQITVFIPRAESFLATSERTLAESRQQLQEVTTKANNVLDITHKQLVRVDEVLSEVTTRARVQIERVEMVMDDTISRVHETVVTLNSGILKPLRELNGMAAGLKAAFQHLLSGGRPNVAQATADEEMFI